MRLPLFQSVLSFLLLFSACSRVDLVATDSKTIHEHVSSFTGEKAVLLNVWSTSCVPCVEEFPMIVNFGNEINDLEVVFVSADFDDQLGAVKDFLSEQKVTGISFIKNEKDQPFINGIHPEWSGSLPFTILYGKISGKILSFWEGKESESKFRAAIQLALND
ncbi:MAG TPA: TlpA family protein disulfide reductase [Candidatus Marinimicrobia bacterium]|nr:TlpA family protein disulfide reductase [Candidatus Neomarinimicrobiota bacterium]